MASNSEYELNLVAKLVGKAGLRGKVDAKCIDCIYDPESGGGTWKQQVEACTVTSCPLYTVRARSEAADGSE